MKVFLAKESADGKRTQYDLRSENPTEEFSAMNAEETLQTVLGRHDVATFVMKINSWYNDACNEDMVSLAARGDLAGIKNYVGDDEESEGKRNNLANSRFCTDPMLTHKYYRREHTKDLIFTGYSLLNAALYNGHEEVANYLMDECGMNLDDRNYGNPAWVSLFPMQRLDEPNEELETKKLQIFKTLVDSGKITPENIRDFASAQAGNTVFHLAADITPAPLRSQTLQYFADNFPEVASNRNTHGADGRTAITSLFETHKKLETVRSPSFSKDLEIIVGCGGFDDFLNTTEYQDMRKKSSPLRPLELDNAVYLAQDAYGEKKLLARRAPSPSATSFIGSKAKSGEAQVEVDTSGRK